MLLDLISPFLNVLSIMLLSLLKIHLKRTTVLWREWGVGEFVWSKSMMLNPLSPWTTHNKGKWLGDWRFAKRVLNIHEEQLWLTGCSVSDTCPGVSYNLQMKKQIERTDDLLKAPQNHKWCSWHWSPSLSLTFKFLTTLLMTGSHFTV